jgi:putative peptide zinc metalloprotease protein
VPADRSAPLDLLLADGTRVPLAGEVTIGRAPDNALRLTDPAVSRRHARIAARESGLVLEDVGSTFGTWLDGERVEGVRPLHDGSRIRVGDQELVVDRRRSEDEAGRTIVVHVADMPDADDARPALRPGYALKRLDAREGPERWVLRDLRSERFWRLSDEDAELLQLLDGSRTGTELAAAAESRLGPAGPARLVRLLSTLEERGLVAGGEEDDSRATGGVRRLVTPHKATWSGGGEFFERAYRRGGWVLFTRPALAALALLSLVGMAVFAGLVIGRYGTPFVVAQKVGLGGLVFLIARFVLVAAHESAHGLAMAAIGRRAGAVGVKLVLIFPYAFVDTSEAWFEPRRRRIFVSAAGPVSDLSLAAIAALACLATGPGTLRDVFFQLAFAAYVGAVFNLNPFVDRDGYQILVDALGEPKLRARAREQLQRRLRGERRESDSPVLARYALFGLAWSLVAALFAIGFSLRYVGPLEHIAAAPLVWAGLAVTWLALLSPVLFTLAGPLRHRGRAGA